MMGAVNCGEFLDGLKNCRFLKEHSGPLSLLFVTVCLFVCLFVCKLLNGTLLVTQSVSPQGQKSVERLDERFLINL